MLSRPLWRHCNAINLGRKWNHWSIPSTHWGRVTHICVNNLALNGSKNGLPPFRCQAMISTDADLLLIGPLGLDFVVIWNEIFVQENNFTISNTKRQPFYPVINVLTRWIDPMIFELFFNLRTSFNFRVIVPCLGDIIKPKWPKEPRILSRFKER